MYPLSTQISPGTTNRVIDKGNCSSFPSDEALLKLFYLALNNISKKWTMLMAADDGLDNLYGAIEKGVIALDSNLQSRVNQLKDRREKVLSEMALVKRGKPGFRKVSPKQVAYATERMRQMLLDPQQGYGKQLLHLLVDEIRVDTQSATLRGSTAALENAVAEMKMGTPVGVPRFVSDWRARRDSNS